MARLPSELKKKYRSRLRRKRLIRSRVIGTMERPRLSVKVSIRHIYVQVIDDMNGRTICAVSTVTKDTKNTQKNVKSAYKIGEDTALLAKKENIKKVVFDRNGRLYHGRVKAVADGARKAGLQF